MNPRQDNLSGRLRDGDASVSTFEPRPNRLALPRDDLHLTRQADRRHRHRMHRDHHRLPDRVPIVLRPREELRIPRRQVLLHP
jgi:hypothetical protein